MIKTTTQLVIILIFIVCGSPIYAQEGFVSVLDNHFELDNEPFYYAGTNNFYLGYFGQDTNYKYMVDEVYGELITLRGLPAVGIKLK